jgi:hypothetical protein
LQDPLKFTQIVIVGLKMRHLATPGFAPLSLTPFNHPTNCVTNCRRATEMHLANVTYRKPKSQGSSDCSYIHAQSGLPDGLFSSQKSHFGSILEGLM